LGRPFGAPEGLDPMDRFSDSYCGYWMEVTLPESWVVRIRATMQDLLPVGVSTFVMPASFTAVQVFENARLRINEVLHIHEFGRIKNRPQATATMHREASAYRRVI
jgi:hypothetical protein